MHSNFCRQLRAPRDDLVQGLANCSPRAKSGPACFCKYVFIGTQPLLFFYVRVSGCFHTTRVELKNWDRDHMVHRARALPLWHILEKALLLDLTAPDLAQFLVLQMKNLRPRRVKELGSSRVKT